MSRKVDELKAALGNQKSFFFYKAGEKSQKATEASFRAAKRFWRAQ